VKLKKKHIAAKGKKYCTRECMKNIVLALCEKKNNFAWETLHYSNFVFNEQTTCAGNLALLTRKKLR